MPNFAYPNEPERWEIHILRDASVAGLAKLNIHHGRPVTAAAPRTKWPQTLLFDKVYASAILHQFGTRGETKKILKSMCDKYHGEQGPMSEVRRRQQWEARAEANAARNQPAQSHYDNAAADDKLHGDDAVGEHEEDVPPFAVWQDALSPHMQRRIYSILTRSAKEKASTALNERVLAWQSQVD